MSVAIENAVNMFDEVEDRSTGFKGTVLGRTDYANGCTQFLVKPRVDKDGKMQEGVWIDVQHLKVTKSATPAPKPRRVGGPSSAQRRT